MLLCISGLVFLLYKINFRLSLVFTVTADSLWGEALEVCSNHQNVCDKMHKHF